MTDDIDESKGEDVIDDIDESKLKMVFVKCPKCHDEDTWITCGNCDKNSEFDLDAEKAECSCGQKIESVQCDCGATCFAKFFFIPSKKVQIDKSKLKMVFVKCPKCHDEDTWITCGNCDKNSEFNLDAEKAECSCGQKIESVQCDCGATCFAKFFFIPSKKVQIEAIRKSQKDTIEDDKNTTIGCGIMLAVGALVLWWVGSGVYGFIKPDCHSWITTFLAENALQNEHKAISMDINDIEEVKDSELEPSFVAFAIDGNMHVCKATAKFVITPNIVMESKETYYVTGKLASIAVGGISSEFIEK